MIKIMFGVAFGIVLAALAIMTIQFMFFGTILKEFLPNQQEKDLKIYQAEMELKRLKQEQQQLLQQKAIQAQREEETIRVAQQRAENAKRDAQQRAEINARDLRQDEAFKAQYKKPSQCYNMQYHEMRVNCANHYIRARAEFAKKYAIAEQNQIANNKSNTSNMPILKITIKNGSDNQFSCGVMRDNKFVSLLQLGGRGEGRYEKIGKVERIGCSINIDNKSSTALTWFNASTGVYTLLLEKVECKICKGIDHTWATIVVSPNGERIYQSV